MLVAGNIVGWGGLVAETGLADRTIGYGISHFVRMEIHDVRDYDSFFEPGMCFVIEWRVQMDDFSIRFEDVRPKRGERGTELIRHAGPTETIQ